MLRMISKMMEKDTKEKMAANMEMINKLIEDMEDQVELVPGVGQVTIKHNLIIRERCRKKNLKTKLTNVSFFSCFFPQQ